MLPDTSSSGEAAAGCHDPPPLPSATRDPGEQKRIDGELEQWGARNLEYVLSPDVRSLCQLPSFSRLWGYDEFYFRNSIAHELVDISRFAQRRLTPDEMALYLHYASRSIVAQSYDRPAAIVGTLFMLHRGGKEYTFPFYQPLFQRFNPRAFPSPHWPLLRGRIAAASWQGLRCGLYSGLGLVTYHLLAPRYRSLYAVDGMIALELEPGLGELRADVATTLRRLRSMN